MPLNNQYFEVEKRAGVPSRGLLRIAAITILALAALFYVYCSISWSWQWDTSAMHYVSFLIDQGKAPYKDIIDINMPGSFMLEGWALKIFGPSDLGWRLYEYLLLAVLTGAMIVIARPYNWLAGLLSGVTFTIIHGSEGPYNAVQREEIMTVLIMAGIAFAFTALRARRSVLMLPAGFFFCLAASLKPTVAPLGVIILMMSIPPLRRRNETAGAYIGWALLGFAGASALVLGFLLRYHVVADFINILKRLVPYYTSIGNQTIPSLIRSLPPRREFALLLVLTLVLTLSNKDWKNWERQVLAIAICFAAFSFVAQRKGFLYHRYPLLAFLLLWMALESFRAIEMKGWMRSVGLVSAGGLLLLLPKYCTLIYQAKPNSVLTENLMLDLRRLGGPKLQNQVECLDMVSGCLGALYRLNLVQYSGFIGDYMLFGPPGSSPSPYYRNLFLHEVEHDPPQVIVLTTAGLSQPDSFDRIAQWPEFIAFLTSHYSLDVTRICEPDKSRGYRIYLLKSRNSESTHKLS